MMSQRDLLKYLIANAHLSEKTLNKSNTEQVSDLDIRKSTGSFYTPIDVALFVWSTVFDEVDGSDTRLKIRNFFRNYDVVEPSNGGGAFLFAYLSLLSDFDLLSEWQASRQAIFANDLNSVAVSEFSKKIQELGLSEKFHFINQDGRAFLENLDTDLKPCIIGNPPYFRQKFKRGSNNFVDIYADFVDRSLDKIVNGSGLASLLVPLSITFSKDFIQLRTKILEAELKKTFVNFDNMPDYVFKQGKSDSTNTNKAISQRITLVNLNAGRQNKTYSTPLISWRSAERSKIFSERKSYFEANAIGRQKIIPKPVDKEQITLLTQAQNLNRFVCSQSCCETARLFFGTTARNFLSVGLVKFRETGISSLDFENAETRDAIFYYLASRKAWQCWQALGDGFHVTKTTLYLLPVPKTLSDNLAGYAEKGKHLWSERQKFEGKKVNQGRTNSFFNFVGATDFCVPD